MTEVAKTTPIYDEDTLGAITSYADVMRLFNESGVAVVSTEDFGDGFKLTNKPELVGVPFIIVDYKFASGDFGNDFAIVRLVTEDGRKCIVTDGSTGIRDQLTKYMSKGIMNGLRVPRGLVRSDYEYTDDKGKQIPATTFYLS